MRNKILAIALIITISVSAVCLKSINMFEDLFYTAFSSQFKVSSALNDNSAVEEIEQGMRDSLDTSNENITNRIPYKKNLVRLNGSFLKNTGTRSYYNNKYGMNITADGYNVGRYEVTSTDYEVSQMISFKEYLDSKDINLLYVSEPCKYIDDSFYTEQFGGESYLNRNTDLFLSRIEEAGIDYLDLRDKIREENKDCMSMFYKTDHHWTVPASQWAAAKIAERLNESYGYNIDMSLYDTNNYNSVTFEDAWLGEQGKLVADTYVGLEDYTAMAPNYNTSFSIINGEGEVESEGDFWIFINKDIYFADDDLYWGPSWHYSYGGDSFCRHTYVNNNIDYGNVLLLGDSYEASMEPFLSIGVHSIKCVIPRELIDISVRDFIEQGDYDTVIVAYAQFMIGAHDDENNANYGMFNLE